MIPTAFITPDDTKDCPPEGCPPEQDESFKKHVMQSLLLQAIIGVVVSIACILFFNNKPPTPPSLAAN